MNEHVLVVEDDAAVRDALGQTLELANISSRLAGSFVVAKDHITKEFTGIILSDIRMPGRDGIYLLNYAQSIDPDLPVILLTGEGDIPMAVNAINKGAFDFLEKPCANETLVEAVRKALKARDLILENRRLRSELTRGDAAARIILGGSVRAKTLRAQIRKIASVQGAVLIDGAPGSGVARVAEAIRMLDPRSDKPLVRVAGAGLTPDKLGMILNTDETETIFIDEFSEMPADSQFQLLAHIEAGTGVRVLAGTSRGLTADEPSGANSDLFYRLEALRLQVPALSERLEDIPAIFRHYVAQASRQANVPEPEIPASVIAGLLDQDWPGNNVALMNAATQFVLGIGENKADGTLGLIEKMAKVERSLIIDALQQNNGNASATAEQLQLPRKTFYDKLTKHGIKPESFRG